MVTLKVKLYSSIKDRTFGLMWLSNPKPVMFLTRYGIHTFGLRFPIDVLVLDENNKVVKASESFKPNRLFFWAVKYNKVLELPEGIIKTKSIKVGSKINIILEP